MAPQPSRNSDPIGILDSGIGGLSVAREIQRLLPHERLVYMADQRMLPYGNKSEAQIRRRVLELAKWLRRTYRIKALVIACNTATAAAAHALRSELGLPVIGMEPAVKPAAMATRNRRIGVLATEGTLKSARFAGLLKTFAAGMHVVTRPCPGLVEAIEAGARERVDALLNAFIAPLIHERVDTIVLGCTHYPLVRQRIAAIAGPGIALIDTGAAVARQTRRQLQHHGLLHAGCASRSMTAVTTADASGLQRSIRQMLPELATIRYESAAVASSSVTDSNASN